MKHIYEKLKSSCGASMIFALLIFVMCVLAGTVALSAASANVGRYTHLVQEQRQYFSVASALELFQSQLKDRVETNPIKVTGKNGGMNQTTLRRRRRIHYIASQQSKLLNWCRLFPPEKRSTTINISFWKTVYRLSGRRIGTI